jgi:hypothetical protein
MQVSTAVRIGVLTVAICPCVLGQPAPTEAKGLGPRAAAADYQAQAQAGTVTVAAEFKGHWVPTLEGTLSTEDYVVVETGLFGPAGARITLSIGDFALRINGRKTPLPSLPYGLVVGSLKDPEWQPPEPPASKSKTGLSTGGGQAEASGPPAEVKIPIAVQRAMAQRVQRAVLPQGDRSLPQGGLIFFQQRGKTENFESIELIYTGPDGKATLKLQP